MKHLFTLVLIASCTSAYSQFALGMHAGASNKNAIIGLNTHYLFKNRFTAGLNIDVHTDKTNPVFFQSRFGYSIGNVENGFSVQPYTGYSYGVQSIERKLYGGHLTAGATLRYQFNSVASVYTDFNRPAPGYMIVSIGIAGRLTRKQ